MISLVNASWYGSIHVLLILYLGAALLSSSCVCSSLVDNAKLQISLPPAMYKSFAWATSLPCLVFSTFFFYNHSLAINGITLLP